MFEIEVQVPDNAELTTGPNPTTVEVSAGGTATDKDGIQYFGRIEGIVFVDVNGDRAFDIDEPRLSNVRVVITDISGQQQTLTTDSSGTYEIDVPVGNTTINIDETSLSGGVAAQTVGGNPNVVDVPAGQTVADIDGFQFAGDGQGVVAGVLFQDNDGDGIQDPNEPPLAGVKIVITDSDGATQTVTTNSVGRYTAVVRAGDVTSNIDESTLPPGAVSQTAGSGLTTINVPVGGTATEQDGFRIADVANGLVSGFVFQDINGNGVQDPGEGLAGVDVAITDENGRTQVVTTNSFGQYTAESPPGKVTTRIFTGSLFLQGFVQIEGENPTTLDMFANVTSKDIDVFLMADEPPDGGDTGACDAIGAVIGDDCTTDLDLAGCCNRASNCAPRGVQSCCQFDSDCTCAAGFVAGCGVDGVCGCDTDTGRDRDPPGDCTNPGKNHWWRRKNPFRWGLWNRKWKKLPRKRIKRGVRWRRGDK
jgi:hypothetical protein